MKKLVLTAFAGLMTFSALAYHNNHCGSCRTRCETRCEAPRAPRVCKTTVHCGDKPNVECIRMVPQRSCCELEKIVDVSYVAACPEGYEEVSRTEPVGKKTKVINHKKEGRSAKADMNDNY